MTSSKGIQSKAVPFWVSNITPEDREAVARSLASGYLTRGPEVEAFEAELCQVSGAKYAVCVSSGTTALMLACRSLDTETVVVHDGTFRGVVNAIRWAGRTPVFVDSQPTGHSCIATTLHGRDWLNTASISDQAHGPVTHLDALHKVSVLSFDYQKHVRSGEGGALLTNYGAQAQVYRHQRDNQGDGFNARMPEMCAALGRSQFSRYETNRQARLRIARTYHAAMPTLCPPWQDDDAPLYYACWHDEAPLIRYRLEKAGIETRVHYPSISGLPEATKNAQRTFSLPLYPELTDEQIAYVISQTQEAMRG